MNILLIGKFNKEEFALHISETLTKLGHNVINQEAGPKTLHSNSIAIKRLGQLKNSIYNTASSIPFFTNFTSKALIKLIRENKIDLTLSIHDFLTPDIVRTIKELTKSPVALWFPDAVSNFGKMMFLNAKYDYLFFKDPYIVDYMQNTLLKSAFYLPECCNPEYHKKVDLNENDKSCYGCDITTAGNLYSNRVALFSNLIKYNIKIWGNPAPLWMEVSVIQKMIMNKYVFNTEKAKAFSAAKIVLNNLHPAEISGINCRAFEIPACGGFEMINFRPSIINLYEIDKEIVTFNNFNELIEKIDYYLEHEYERSAIAEAGWIRTHREHTYIHRLELMLKTIFENGKGYEMPELIKNNNI